MKYLITGKVEFYQWVEADSEDEASDQMENGQWYQTMNQPIQDVQIKQMEVDTTGVEVK